MNGMGFLYGTKPPKSGDEFGFVVVFNLSDMRLETKIDDKKFCRLGSRPGLSEKYIPDYPDVNAIVLGGGGGDD